jgi:hypothetical protein
MAVPRHHDREEPPGRPESVFDGGAHNRNAYFTDPIVDRLSGERGCGFSRIRFVQDKIAST